MRHDLRAYLVAVSGAYTPSTVGGRVDKRGLSLYDAADLAVCLCLRKLAAPLDRMR